jgi:hypothetical protein
MDKYHKCRRPKALLLIFNVPVNCIEQMGVMKKKSINIVDAITAIRQQQPIAGIASDKSCATKEKAESLHRQPK